MRTGGRKLWKLCERRKRVTVEPSERGKMQTATPSASDEEERLRREVEESERLKAAKQRLDDQDEWRQQKSAEFGEKYVERPPPKFVLEKVETSVEEARQKKLSAQEEFLKDMAAKREEKAKRQEEKKAEGKARQAKTEAKSKKTWYTWRKN
jgi:chromatin assembly factor 1 subunit A